MSPTIKTEPGSPSTPRLSNTARLNSPTSPHGLPMPQNHPGFNWAQIQPTLPSQPQQPLLPSQPPPSSLSGRTITYRTLPPLSKNEKPLRIKIIGPKEPKLYLKWRCLRPRPRLVLRLPPNPNLLPQTPKNKKRERVAGGGRGRNRRVRREEVLEGGRLARNGDEVG